MYSVWLRVLPTSTSRLEGEIIFILVTFRSMMSAGRSNSSTMQRGMAPPQGCTIFQAFRTNVPQFRLDMQGFISSVKGYRQEHCVGDMQGRTLIQILSVSCRIIS